MINEKIRHFRKEGVPARTASRFASLRIFIIILELGKLAKEYAVGIELVIKLFFLIGSQLKIHTLRYNADTLSTDNVWQDRARVEFIQELNRLQTVLTSNALRYYQPGDEITKSVELWLNDNSNNYSQYQDVYEKMKFTETNELAMLSVVLSKLRLFS